MTLDAWLRQQGVSRAEFAELIGASEEGVAKWLRGERIPRRAVMQRIVKATRGRVTATDFYAAVLARPATSPPARARWHYRPEPDAAPIVFRIVA
jgi:transcriptional regulator with XRE-family HTH domain